MEVDKFNLDQLKIRIIDVMLCLTCIEFSNVFKLKCFMLKHEILQC